MAILFWREYVKAGGLELDQLLWNIDAGAESCLANTVANALANGRDGSSVTAEFLYLSGNSADIMRADIDHLIDEYTTFGEHITSLFIEWINLAQASVQDTIWSVG